MLLQFPQFDFLSTARLMPQPDARRQGKRGEGGGGSSDDTDFEFLLGGCGAMSMLHVDEFFPRGKLMLLHNLAPSVDKEVGRWCRPRHA
jgi:hypothetical protein